MVENQLYTFGIEQENLSSLSYGIRLAISDLQKEYPEQKIVALNWDKEYVAIPLQVRVNLPNRGTAGNIDIRKIEPIYLLLHRKYYPYKAPSVHYDRIDFPENRLPHINPRSTEKAASFCFHRGNIDNWFIEHTIVDIVERAREWLYDAAGGYLIRKEDGFEPTRLNESAGCAIYDPSPLLDLITKNWRKEKNKGGFAFLLYKLLDNPGKEKGIEKYVIGLMYIPKKEEFTQLLEYVRVNNIIPDNKERPFLFGVLVWSSKKSVCEEYFSKLPNDFGQLQYWTKKLDLPLDIAIETFLSKKLCINDLIPVTLAVPRPQNLIGSNSKIELLNFMINASDRRQKGKLDTDMKVEIMTHIAPLTHNKAKEISSLIGFDHSRLLFIGCGAIGSKLILHLARSGQCNMTLVDYERLNPHNLVRHALLGNTGMNKAEAIKKSIEEMFYADKALGINIVKESALNILFGNGEDILNHHDLLIDSTASPVIIDALCRTNLPKALLCYRCEIANNGQLGFLSQEGSKRNPRLDDLQIHLYHLASEDEAIANWLKSCQKQREQDLGSPLEEINIGISCSSETMKLADEIVSLHAAFFAPGLRLMAKETKSNTNGRIQINYYNANGIETPTGITLGHSRLIEVNPLNIISAKNADQWQIRIRYGIKQQLHALLRQAMPNETGGLLIGLINSNRKIIYITDILPAPLDSDSSPFAFKRGCHDVPKEISNIENYTGKMLGYVGEWHTHPNGEPGLSVQDKRSIEEIKKCLDNVPMPTHVMVVTNSGLHSYVFEPNRGVNN